LLSSSPSQPGLWMISEASLFLLFQSWLLGPD
jgi:hypothetical protein